MSSEVSLPQYLNCQTVSRSTQLEGILVVCVSLGGTPFVFLVITVLCIATSCVLQKVYSRILLSAMCVVFGSCSEIGLLHFSWLVKFVAKFGKYGRNCVSDRGKCGHLSRDIRVN